MVQYSSSILHSIKVVHNGEISYDTYVVSHTIGEVVIDNRYYSEICRNRNVHVLIVRALCFWAGVETVRGKQSVRTSANPGILLVAALAR